MSEIKELGMRDIGELKQLFSGIFSAEPWNDDWSDDLQLHSYIEELIGNSNSVAFGLFSGGELIGASMGSIKHWWQGTEYHIDEFFIKTAEQGKGLGTGFLEAIEESVRSKGVTRIFLQTDRHAPAYKFYLKNGFTDMTDHVSLVKNI